MRDPVGAPVWLQIVALIVWMIGLGMWAERNRFGGTKDLLDDVDRLTTERDRARAELEERRRSAMPTLTLVPPAVKVDTARDLAARRLGRSGSLAR